MATKKQKTSHNYSPFSIEAILQQTPRNNHHHNNNNNSNSSSNSNSNSNNNHHQQSQSNNLIQEDRCSPIAGPSQRNQISSHQSAENTPIKQQQQQQQQQHNHEPHLNQVGCSLDNKDMWDKFHSLNTEMIITKTGRRMFPVLKIQFHNLNPSARYAVSMDIVPVDNKRYRYAYHKSCWQIAGKADPSAEARLYPHPDSPFNGDILMKQIVSFEKVKLTNNEMDKSGHIILNSMHKYQPRVHLIELQTPQQQPPPFRTFAFPETVFTAVTAYQNQLITKMKIDKNPFAKGFRDSSRLSDLDYTSPLGHSGSCSLDSANGVTGAHLDAFQLITANNHWYSAMAAAAGGGNGNPFSVCSQAQAAQAAQAAQIQTQMMLAAFSAYLNGGAAATIPTSGRDDEDDSQEHDTT